MLVLFKRIHTEDPYKAKQNVCFNLQHLISMY
jgi:hypothetical protein